MFKSRKLLIACLLLLIFSMVGCNNSVKNEEPVVSEEEESVVFTGSEGDWEMNLPSSFEMLSEEIVEDQDWTITYFKGENGLQFNIGQMINSEMEVSEAALLEELEEEHYFHILRTESIKLADGTFYGVLIEDEELDLDFLYYKMKKDNKIVTFVIYQDKPFTLEEEVKIKAILSTFKAI